MSGQITEQDQRTLARWAEATHTMDSEAARQHKALEEADDATLRAVLSDCTGSEIVRGTALMLLLTRNRHRRDSTLSDILLPLWDDPDKQFARMAIEQTPPFDPELAERLHVLLDNPERLIRFTAASVLARRKDTTIVPRLRRWFCEGDQDHRNVAWSCLCFYQLLGPDECRALLREAWDAGGRDDDDRAMLAVGLLGLGDRVGWTFLVELARRADQHSACWVAETILEHDPTLGLDLILHILDHGTTFQVRWGMVERIAGAAGLPHVWTADGLAEARYWIEQQRQRMQLGQTVTSLHSLRPAPPEASLP
jgi:hypothetical protein